MSSVKYFHSAMTGAPVLSGTAGSLIGVLDACLVNGFGLTTVDSIVVASGVATASMSTGHSFEADTTALIAGSITTALNGEKTVLTTSTNTITFSAAGVADGAYTGAGVTAKLAPAGWEKAFAGTNLAAYRSADITSTRMYLRLDDTAVTTGRVVGYETMTDVNTGTGPFPTSAQVSGGGWWPKATASGATARAWTVIASSKAFYIHTHTATSSLGMAGSVWGFGDIISLKAGDAYGAFLGAHTTDSSSSTGAVGNALEYGNGTSLSTNPGLYVSRPYTSIGSSTNCYNVQLAFGANSAGPSGTINFMAAYPNGPNNSLLLSRKAVIEPSGPVMRGTLPGALHAGQNCHLAFNWRDKLDGQGEFYGHKLMAVKCGAPAGTTSSGVMFFDITGPWS